MGEDKVFALAMKKNKRTKLIISDLEGNILHEEDSKHFFHCFFQADYDPFLERIGLVQDNHIYIFDKELNVLKDVEVDEARGSRLVGFSFSFADSNRVYVTFPKQNNGLSPYTVEGKGKVYWVNLESEEVERSINLDAFHIDTLMEWGTKNELLVMALYRHGYVMVMDQALSERNRLYFPYPHSVRSSPEGMVAVYNGAYMVESNLFMVLGDMYNDYSRGNDPPFWGVGDPFHYGTVLSNLVDFHPRYPQIVTWSRYLSGGIAHISRLKEIMGRIAYVQLANGFSVEKKKTYRVKIDWAKNYTYLPVYGEALVGFNLRGEVRVYRFNTGYTPFGAKAGQTYSSWTTSVDPSTRLKLSTGTYFFDFTPEEDGHLYAWAEIRV